MGDMACYDLETQSVDQSQEVQQASVGPPVVVSGLLRLPAGGVGPPQASSWASSD